MKKYSNYTNHDQITQKTIVELQDKFDIEIKPMSWSQDLDGFRTLAFKPPVKSAYYNKDRNLLVKYTEGDIMVVVNPTEKYINDLLSHYPKAEVCAEEYDERFDREVKA